MIPPVHDVPTRHGCKFFVLLVIVFYGGVAACLFALGAI